jgi:hypothetical protein
MKMQSTERLHIKGLDMIKDEMETITFSQFIEETFNISFDEIYKDFKLDEDIKNEERCDLE